MMLYRSGARSPFRNICRESASAASAFAALRRSAWRRSACPQPSSAIRAARSKVCLNVRLPKRFNNASYPAIAPGTVAAFTPDPGTLFTRSLSVKNCGVHAAGAHPPEFSAYSFLSRADHTSAKRSPPMPVSFCEVTSRTAPAATAASMALPPCRSISRPACAASGSLVATMPWRASTSDRPCASHPCAREPAAASIAAVGVG